MLSTEKLDNLEDLRGKEYRELTLHDKARLMTVVLPPGFSSPVIAKKLAKIIKSGHKCGRDTCHNSCHYNLKAKVFDLLWAKWMR